MASEYLKRKYQDVKPEEKRELTQSEKRRNWWHYHWHFVVLSVAAAVVLGRIAVDHLTRVQPDCSVALVVRFAPTGEEIGSLQSALEAVCPDANGDGKVSVAVNVIQLDYAAIEAGTMEPQVMTANIDKLNADFYTHQSGLFLMDDPAGFQAANGALAAPDGSLPDEGADWRTLTVPWRECAVEQTSFRQLGEDGLWLGRRAAYTEAEENAFAGAAALWETLAG